MSREFLRGAADGAAVPAVSSTRMRSGPSMARAPVVMALADPAVAHTSPSLAEPGSKAESGLRRAPVERSSSLVSTGVAARAHLSGSVVATPTDAACTSTCSSLIVVCWPPCPGTFHTIRTDLRPVAVKLRDRREDLDRRHARVGGAERGHVDAAVIDRMGAKISMAESDAPGQFRPGRAGSAVRVAGATVAVDAQL